MFAYNRQLCAALLCQLAQLSERGDEPFAVARHRDRTCLVFRGTSSFNDMLDDAYVLPRRATNLFSHLSSHADDETVTNMTVDDAPPTDVRVHAGFLRAYEGVADCLPTLHRPVVAGYSLGGALAVLHACRVPVSQVYLFGAPRVGNRGFQREYARLPHQTHRFHNHRDIVPRLPPGYKHVGTRISLPASEHSGHSLGCYEALLSRPFHA